MNQKAIELLERAIRGLKNYSEPPVIRVGPYPLKDVYDDTTQALDLLKQQPKAGEWKKLVSDIISNVLAHSDSYRFSKQYREAQEEYWIKRCLDQAEADKAALLN